MARTISSEPNKTAVQVLVDSFFKRARSLAAQTSAEARRAVSHLNSNVTTELGTDGAELLLLGNIALFQELLLERLVANGGLQTLTELQTALASFPGWAEKKLLPEGASVEVNSDGSFTYTPPPEE